MLYDGEPEDLPESTYDDEVAEWWAWHMAEHEPYGTDGPRSGRPSRSTRAITCREDRT